MENILNIIERYTIIPVFYDDDPMHCENNVKACYKGGVRVFEFVNRGNKGLQNFEYLYNLSKNSFPDLKLGIGTIKTQKEAEQFVSLGADFVVSPIFDAEIASYCQQANIFWIPGCMTPTEINMAEKSNVKLVKIFPGNTLGPSYIKSIKPLFPNLKFMPTGGVEVDESNIAAWLDAGVTSVGLGSKLFQDLPQEVTEQENKIVERLNVLFSWINKKRVD